MRDGRIIDIKHLNETEIIELYELFFGKILLKKPDFSYHKNLANSLENENSINIILSTLNQNEISILKLLSSRKIVSFNFLAEKIQILLDLPQATISKSINNLILKKLVFKREEKFLVIPNIYFDSEDIPFTFTVVDDLSEKDYCSKFITDLNNLINYFACKGMSFSNNFSLYKKDHSLLEESFSSYSNLSWDDYNIISYFFSISFRNDDGSTNYINIKEFFNLSIIERVFYFIKITFPAIHTIMTYFNNHKTDVIIDLNHYTNLWEETFLHTEYNYFPVKYNLEETLRFMVSTELISIEDNKVTIKYYETSFSNITDEVKISSNFNFYINANSISKDFYFPSLFADFIKYNKIVEFEITESSIQRGINEGIILQDILDYFNNFNLQVSNNVETTIKHWFDKNASFYYATGTIFFCDNKEKGKIIKTLIKNGLIKAYEIKKDEIFIIPENEISNFFSVVTKAGINYYKKDIIKDKTVSISKTFDIEHFFKQKKYLTAK